MMRRILLIIALVLVLIQFIRPGRNQSSEPSAKDIAAVYTVPDSVARILKKSCNDCHSNNTIYPWYTNIQPVGWWMQWHVNEGKEELNFSEFGAYEPGRQAHKMKETLEQVKGEGMPLDSYTWVHKDAILTEQEKALVTAWAGSLEKEIRAKYHLPEEKERRRREE